MFENNIAKVCAGECSLGKIVLVSQIPDPMRYVCRIGEKAFDRFFYVTKGCFYIRNTDGESIEVPAGSVLYLPKDVEYESYWDDKVRGGYISFNFMLNDGKGEHIPLSDKVELVATDAKGELHQLFQKALEQYIDHEMFVEMVLQSLFYRIIYTIVRQISIKELREQRNSRDIYKAMVYLNDNYMNEVTTEDLAAMCGLSVATFRRVFKKYNNVSPIKYKNRLKMLHAREMLQSGLYTVSEVSDIVNCTDLSHFNKLYHTEFETNPSDDIPKC